MKILETNYLSLIKCKIQDDDGQISNKLFFLDNKSDYVFELDVELKTTDQKITDIVLEKYKKHSSVRKQINVSDLIGRDVPSMDDILKMVTEQKQNIPAEN